MNAFSQIKKGLGKTSGVLQTKAQATLAGLRAAKEADKAAPFLAKAEEVSKMGDEMIDYIEILKARAIACSMKGDPTGANYEEYMTEDKKMAIDLGSKEGRENVTTMDENKDKTTLLVGPNQQALLQNPRSSL